MKFLKGVFVLLILILQSGYAQGAPRVLTIEDCIRLAITQSTTVLESEFQTHLTAAQVLQSYGQFLPNLQAQVHFGEQTGKTLLATTSVNNVNSTGENAGFTLVSTLNLFNGLSDFAGIQSALSSRDAALQTLNWAKQQVALDISQNFLQLILDQKLLDISKQNLVASQARLKLLAGQTRVGAASLPDFYRQQAQTSADTFSVTNYQAKVSDDESLILRKLRVDPLAQYIFQPPLFESKLSPLISKSVEELIREALKTRPDIKSNELLLNSNDWKIDQARSGYLPKLDLVFQRNAGGTYYSTFSVNGNNVLPSYQNDLGAQLGNQVQYSVMLNLSWNLFDRFLTHVDIQQAQVKYSRSEVALQDSKYQLQQDIKTAYIDYKSSIEQVATAKVGVDAAVKSFEAIEGMYRVGSASIVDVLTAQVALAQSRASLARAHINQLLQEKALQYSVGQPPQ